VLGVVGLVIIFGEHWEDYVLVALRSRRRFAGVTCEHDNPVQILLKLLTGNLWI